MSSTLSAPEIILQFWKEPKSKDDKSKFMKDAVQFLCLFPTEIGMKIGMHYCNISLVFSSEMLQHYVLNICIVLSVVIGKLQNSLLVQVA
jgi:hypothetical protein